MFAFLGKGAFCATLLVTLCSVFSFSGIVADAFLLGGGLTARVAKPACSYPLSYSANGQQTQRIGSPCRTQSSCVRESASHGGVPQTRLFMTAGESAGDKYAEATITVKGQSKGGYFRAHARNEALYNRGLTGALKEVDSETTEIVVEGRTKAIDAFVRWCKRGPGLTQRIDDVSINWSEYTGIFEGFTVFPATEEERGDKVAGMP